MKSWFLDEIAMFIPCYKMDVGIFVDPGCKDTTRIITCLGSGIPNVKPSFASVTGWGVDPSYNMNDTWIVFLCRLFVQTQHHRPGATKIANLYPWKHGWLRTEIHWEDFISSTKQDSSPSCINEVTSVWQNCQNPSSIQQSSGNSSFFHQILHCYVRFLEGIHMAYSPSFQTPKFT